MENEGILYLCATPIGNLEDMTFRAVRILQEVDLIAAEDTRNSVKLLGHFDIHTPMTSYHEYNKIEKGKKLVAKLKEGKNIALITDAGTPGISDPGEELVKMCYEENVCVRVLPGACAAVSALTLSGLSTRRFAFEAFLPKDKKEREDILKTLERETRTIVLYEAPHRLLRTLRELEERLGNRKVTVCRELTKRYETVYVSSLQGAYAYYENHTPRGECVLVIEGVNYEILKEEERQQWEKLSIKDHMLHYEKQGLASKEAMKKVAKDRGVSKRDIYKVLLQEKEL